jgi:hypothetical protein
MNVVPGASAVSIMFVLLRNLAGDQDRLTTEAPSSRGWTQAAEPLTLRAFGGWSLVRFGGQPIATSTASRPPQTTSYAAALHGVSHKRLDVTTCTTAL